MVIIYFKLYKYWIICKWNLEYLVIRPIVQYVNVNWYLLFIRNSQILQKAYAIIREDLFDAINESG